MVEEALEIGNCLHLIDGVRGVHSYLVGDRGSHTLVDAGLSGNAKKIVEYVGGLGTAGGKLETTVLIHPDIDHSGNVARLKEITRARVAIHEADASRLSGEKELKSGEGVLGAVMKAFGGIMRLTPVKPDVLPKDGDEIAGLTVVFTPGHAEGSISLCVPGVALFVGDALRTSDSRTPLLPPSMMRLDMKEAKNSIRKLAALDFAILLPGHGPPIERDASKTLKEFVAGGFR